MNKKKVTFRLSAEAQVKLKALAADLGVTQTAVVEMLIRKGGKG